MYVDLYMCKGARQSKGFKIQEITYLIQLEAIGHIFKGRQNRHGGQAKIQSQKYQTGSYTTVDKKEHMHT